MSRVPRVYVDRNLAPGAEIRADERVRRHLIKVLRLRSGAALRVFDGHGNEFAATLDAKGESPLLRLGGIVPAMPESRLRICLVQGISRGERMDMVIQKATELGVAEIRPVMTRRSVVRLDERRGQTRLRHWRSIVASACEQCGRATLTRVYAPEDLDPALDALPADGTRLMLDPGGEAPARESADGGLVLLIGPEGGLTESEKQGALDRGFRRLALGPRILRTETAAIAAVTAVQCLWGDFRGGV